MLADAGKNGLAEYREIRILEVPAPEPPSPGLNRAPLQKTPQYRGAMAGALKEEEDFRIFAEEFGGNLLRWQFLQGGPAVFQTTERYLAWGRDRIAELKHVLPYCHKYKIKVVIDLHRSPGEMNAINNNLGLWTAERQQAVVLLWREIAEAFKGDSAIYGYDLVNEPVQSQPAPYDYWNLQRMAAEAVRAIDPDTPIIIESNNWDSPSAFSYLPPLEMKDVIYQVHMYVPGNFTHQLVGNNFGEKGQVQKVAYPGLIAGVEYDREALRKVLAPVRDFQQKYGARIFVGEFSAAVWAPGAEKYLADCISLFEEYGWDWTYHAYREWNGWSLEHAGDWPDEVRPSADNPRKRVLLEGFSRNVK